MKNVSELKGYFNFHQRGRVIFEDLLSSFLNCRVNIQIHKIEEFEKGMGIDITSNIMRNCYTWGARKDEMIIVPKVFSNDHNVLAVLPIRLSGPGIHTFPQKYLDRITKAISVCLTECAKSRFHNSTTIFGPEFESIIIPYCLTSNSKETKKFSYLVSLISKLSRTTFESNEFSTAFIYTRSGHEYSRNIRSGTLLQLKNTYNILKAVGIDKRFWYLCDGIYSAYIINNNFEITSMYLRDGTSHGFLDGYSWRYTLQGADILFRVTGLNQISIIDSDGIELCFSENKWKIRNYNTIINIIEENSGIAHEVVDALISNIIFCSQNKISSIIWLPENIAKISDFLVKEEMHFKQPISIKNSQNKSIVERIISSDGVSIVDNIGNIIAHGSIVSLNKVDNEGLVGTGESAAKLLAHNGVAIKISQDGNIKVLYSNGEKMLIF